MGLRLNLAAGDRPLGGFVNLDKATGWTFESGLGDYTDESVEAISESHGLMFVQLADWPLVFAEFARVLEPGGMVRVTEDATTDPKSPRFGGHHDAVTLTDPPLVVGYMTLAGLEAQRVGEDETGFRDRSLIQNVHGGEPKVFFVEGTKPCP